LYSADPYKRFEYWSRAYRYNGRVFAIARNLFAHPDFESDGFVPALGRLNPSTERTVANALDQDATALEQARQPFWDTKVRYLRELAADTSRRHARLVLLHTPLYEQDPVAHRMWSDRIRSLLDDLPGVTFVDICEATRPEIFAGKPALYNDVNHLNEQGAIIFSNLLADELKARLLTDAGLNQPAYLTHAWWAPAAGAKAEREAAVVSSAKLHITARSRTDTLVRIDGNRGRSV
jgi:hypothetical protein